MTCSDTCDTVFSLNYIFWLYTYFKFCFSFQSIHCLTTKSIVETESKLLTTSQEIPSGFLSYLKGRNVESIISCLNELQKLTRTNSFDLSFWTDVQKTVAEIISRENYPPLLSKCCTLLSDLHLKYGTPDDIVTVALWDRTRGITAGQGSVGAGSLELGGICVSCLMQRDK